MTLTFYTMMNKGIYLRNFSYMEHGGNKSMHHKTEQIRVSAPTISSSLCYKLPRNCSDGQSHGLVTGPKPEAICYHNLSSTGRGDGSKRNQFCTASEELLHGLSDFLHSSRRVPCPTIPASPLSRARGNPEKHKTSSRISALPGGNEVAKVVGSDTCSEALGWG